MSLAGYSWAQFNSNKVYELWAFGENSQGECGVGTTTDVTTWTKVGTAQNWRSIACGRNHTIGLRNDGTLWAWGDNSLYQLGDGTTTDSLVPKQIGTDTDWYMIGATDNGSFAAKIIPAAGGVPYYMRIYYWGRPFSFTSTFTTPTIWVNGRFTIPGTSTSVPVEYFDCGRDHMVLRVGSSAAYAAGGNSLGQLGDGTTTNRANPVYISDPETTSPNGPQPQWCYEVTAGAYHSNFLRPYFNVSFPFRQKVFGCGDINNGSGFTGGTLRQLSTGYWQGGSRPDASGTVTNRFESSDSLNLYHRLWGRLSNNLLYGTPTLLTTPRTGTNPKSVLTFSAANGIFARGRDDGNMFELTNATGVWSPLSTDIKNTIQFAGWSETGTTNRRLFALREIQPTSSFTLTKISDTVYRLTNTSVDGSPYTPTGLTADNRTYLIDWGDGTTSIVKDNSTTGAPGLPIDHTYPASDGKYTVTLTTYRNLVSNFATSSQTITNYVTQSPTFTVTEQGTGPTITVLNTSPNTLGATAVFGAGNFWRWDWNDGTYTDVPAGGGDPGARLVPLTHLYTFTPAEIAAGVAVSRSVTLKAYNGHPSSPFSSTTTTVSVIPVNPTFPNVINTTTQEAGIPAIFNAPGGLIWGKP